MLVSVGDVRLYVDVDGDAGHMLAAEQPEAVLKLVREFVLEDQADGGPAG